MRVTILGTGAIAAAHAGAIDGLSAHGVEAVLAHAIDIDPARAEDFARNHGVAGHGTDLTDVLGDTDVLHVCTPPGAHVDATVAALQAGVHVVVEKPATLSLAEIDRIAEAEAASTATFTQVVQHRFGHGLRQLRRLLDAGELGRPLVATCNTLWFRAPEYFEVPWRGRWDTEGGGPTMGHGIHQFDLLLAVLGPWSEVTAMAGRLDRYVDTEDVSMAVVRFENGAMATIANSLLSPRETSDLRFDRRAVAPVRVLGRRLDVHAREGARRRRAAVAAGPGGAALRAPGPARADLPGLGCWRAATGHRGRRTGHARAGRRDLPVILHRGCGAGGRDRTR